MKNNGYLWGAGVAVVIIIVAVIAFDVHKASAPGSVASSTGLGTTTVDLGNGETVTLPPGVTLNESTSSPSGGVQPPSLTGSIIISSSLPADAQAALRTDEEATIAELKAAPTRADLWLQLGVDRKIGGDYAGAIAAWDYVATAGPGTVNYIAYGNLGDLYMNFQVNYPKAEAEYKAAIAINPTVIDYYKDLYTLYTSFYKTNMGLATSIVAQGLKANPQNPDLLQLQAQLKSNQ